MEYLLKYHWKLILEYVPEREQRIIYGLNGMGIKHLKSAVETYKNNSWKCYCGKFLFDSINEFCDQCCRKSSNCGLCERLTMNSQITNGVCYDCYSKQLQVKAICDKCNNEMVDGECYYCLVNPVELCKKCDTVMNNGKCYVCEKDTDEYHNWKYCNKCKTMKNTDKCRICETTDNWKNCEKCGSLIVDDSCYICDNNRCKKCDALFINGKCHFCSNNRCKRCCGYLINGNCPVCVDCKKCGGFHSSENCTFYDIAYGLSTKKCSTLSTKKRCITCNSENCICNICVKCKKFKCTCLNCKHCGKMCLGMKFCDNCKQYCCKAKCPVKKCLYCTINTVKEGNLCDDCSSSGITTVWDYCNKCSKKHYRFYHKSTLIWKELCRN